MSEAICFRSQVKPCFEDQTPYILENKGKVFLKGVKHLS
jgi:hypothetical protein